MLAYGTDYLKVHRSAYESSVERLERNLSRCAVSHLANQI